MFGKRRRPRSGPDLREQVFALDPVAIGCSPDGIHQVWGVMVDISLDDSMATVLSLVDGSTSLYTSSSGGVIGGGAIEPISLASEALVYAAEHDIDTFAPSDDTAPPEAGYSRFWLLTYAGVRMAEAHSDDIDRDHPLWRVQLGAQGVISALRQHGGD